jgi:hypothetical protein
MEDSGGSLSEVTIGNVSGGISNSVIAGRDVSHVTISVAGRDMSGASDATYADLRQLVGDVQRELVEVLAQHEVLKKVSPAAPHLTQGAAESVKDAAASLAEKPAPTPQRAATAQERLQEATSVLGTVLDGAKSIAEKTKGTAESLRPLIERLVPLMDKLAVAAVWAARLAGLP